MAVMPVSLVLAVIVYFSGDGFLPVARIELSGSLLRTAPPADFMVPGSSTAQIACLAVFSHSTSRAGKLFSRAATAASMRACSAFCRAYSSPPPRSALIPAASSSWLGGRQKME